MSVDTRGMLGEASAEPAGSESGASERAPFAPTLALTVTLAVACFTLVMSLALLAIHPDLSILYNSFGYQQNQHAKTALYVVAFAVILPVALIAAPRVADTVSGGPNARALPVLAAVLAATLAAAIIVVKLSGHFPWGDGLGVVLGAVVIWFVGAAAVLARAARPRPWSPLLRIAASARIAPVIAGVLVLGLLLSVTSLKSVSLLPLALGSVVVAGVLVVHEQRRLPRLPRWWGNGMDLLIVVILLLAVPDVVIFQPSSVAPNPFFPPGVIQWHHDFLLGPTNQLLRTGGALLVNDPVSQYGVGFIYFLSGWFHLAPIGYGTYGLIDGILTALFYVAGYCLLRLAGVSRLLAGSALAVGVVALVYHLPYSVGGLPEQGPLRFGLPMAMIVATVAGARWPRRARAARVAALAVLGVASIWAVEAFAYTLAAFAAMVALDAWLLPPGRRVRWLARQAVLAAAACICAHLVLAGATLAGTGQLPHWGQYLVLVSSFLGGQAGEVVYGFAPWSPGLAVGGAFLASGAALVLLARRRPGFVRRERTALIALAGATAYSIALFSWVSSRSGTSFLPYVTLPALLAAALWLSLLLRSPRDVSRGARLGGLAFALSVAVLLVAAAWSSVGGRFPSTALAHAYPGGRLGAAVRRLWHPPPIDPRAPEGERLLDRYMPGQRRVLILLPASADLADEILIRSRRANKLPLGDPKADSYVPSARVPALRRAIAQLRPGDRLLIDRAAQRVLAAFRVDPSIDPLKRPLFYYWPVEDWLLQQIGERFQVHPIYDDKEGFIVAQLLPRA